MIPPAPDPSVCIVEYPSWNWGRYSVIPVVVLQGVMCIIAIFQSFIQSFHQYKVTRRWQFNQYIKLLVEQGILYFLMFVFTLPLYTDKTNGYLDHSNLFHVIIVQGLFSITFAQTPSLILSSIAIILPFALNPRFILSIRELYAQNIQGQGIDTGFGMVPGHTADIGTTLSFADPGLVSNGIEEIPMEEQRARRYVNP